MQVCDGREHNRARQPTAFTQQGYEVVQTGFRDGSRKRLGNHEDFVYRMDHTANE